MSSAISLTVLSAASKEIEYVDMAPNYLHYLHLLYEIGHFVVCCIVCCTNNNNNPLEETESIRKKTFNYTAGKLTGRPPATGKLPLSILTATVVHSEHLVPIPNAEPLTTIPNAPSPSKEPRVRLSDNRRHIPLSFWSNNASNNIHMDSVIAEYRGRGFRVQGASVEAFVGVGAV